MKFNSLVFYVLSLMLLVVSLMSLMISISLFSSMEVYMEWEMNLIELGSMSFLCLLDFMSMMFFSTVMLIAGSVMLYSTSYMSNDKVISRFGLTVFSFVLSMILLIFSPNLLSILLGWDGLGVTSYLLVNYYSSEKSYNASMLTALTNRMGDVAILVLLFFFSFKSMFNYGLMFSSNFSVGVLQMLLILGAAMTKSAQIPFSAWLPAAMAAPTPVSALVHSSTLVTAGVYLLIRFNSLFFSSGFNHLIMMIGVLTMVMAGFSANMEMDMKKIIALSTLSQLGVMFFSLGLGQPLLSFIHLISHAYFKAMMFMAAGSLIHSLKEYQDIRKMGSLALLSPLISSVLLVASLSLCGLPFMSGFFSKDLILEYMMCSNMNMMALMLAIVATFMTITYSARVVLKIHFFFSKREPMSIESDAYNSLCWSKLILILPSVMGGWLLSFNCSSPNVIMLPFFLKTSIIFGLSFFFFFSLFMKLSITPTLISLSGAHQMWFMPVVISPQLSHLSNMNMKLMSKASDMTWFYWMMGSWAHSSSGMVHLLSSLSVKVMSGLGVLMVFTLLM